MGVPDGLHGAYRQRSLVTRFGRYEVEARIRDGTLTRLWTGVLVEADRAHDPLTRAAAALLLHRDRAVLCGPTAARLLGCDAINSEVVHVLRPYGPGMRPRPGMAVHSGRLPTTDLAEIDGLPTLTLERTVADLLCTAAPRDALAVTDQALAGQPETRREEFRVRLARQLAARADGRGTRRGTGLLALATGRAESPPESWLLLEVVSMGYPPPEANWSLRAPDGTERYRLDLAWPELRIAVEYNGYAVHAGREVLDERRAADLRRRGWIVIMVTVQDLSDPARLARLLREAFARRGAVVR